MNIAVSGLTGAAAIAPADATPLSRLPAKLAETLETMSDEDLEFIIRALQVGKQDRANDAALMALKPEFDEVFDNWWKRWEDSMEHSRAVDAAVQ